MPEYPDIVVYKECLEDLVQGEVLEGLRVVSAFVVRTFDPPISELRGKKVLEFRRMGKRIVFGFEGDLFLVMHLMVAGRLRWHERVVKDGKAVTVKVPKRLGLVGFDFPKGTLVFTEAGTKKRASLHLVRGEEGLVPFDRGGLELFETTPEEFQQRLVLENHTLKRTLTDPRLFSGIGNAYSDEILLRAKLSPMKWSTRLNDEEVERLRSACLEVLTEWTERLRGEAKKGFPKKVTAFRPEMGAHGKYKEPCPQCDSPIQRIIYAENEANYCAKCQTKGKLLADRAMSRLLKKDWPKNLQELEERMGGS